MANKKKWTNKELLTALYKSKKMTQETLASAIGIKRQTFNAKLNSRRDFTQSEIMDICTILNIDAKKREAVFFAM